LQSRQRAITKHHRADGRSSSFVAPTGDHSSSSRRQRDLLIIVAPTSAIYFMRCANVRQ
jgi:hypothetical protein